MEITLKNGVGTYAVGICGIADVEDVTNAEAVVSDEQYSNFSKKELFWTVYDKIILPSRKNISEGPDHSLRLLNIERNDTSLNMVRKYFQRKLRPIMRGFCKCLLTVECV